MYKTLRKITQILYSFSLIVALALGPLVSLALPEQVRASYTPCSDVSKGSVRIVGGELGTYNEGEISELHLTLDVSNLETGTYKAYIYDSNDILADLIDGMSSLVTAGNSQPFTVGTDTTQVKIELKDGDGSAFAIRAHYEYKDKDEKFVHLFKQGALNLYTTPSYCQLGKYVIVNDHHACTQPIKITQLRDTDGNPATLPQECVANNGTSCVDASTPFTLTVEGLVAPDGSPYQGRVDVEYGAIASSAHTTTSPGKLEIQKEFSAGDYEITLSAGAARDFIGPCTATFEVTGRCNASDSCSEKFTPTAPGGTAGGNTYELCAQIGNEDLKINCTECNNKDGVWTAVGCIERDPKSIVARFLEIGLGLGGGVCLLTCLAGGFMITTSQGEPKKINDAKEMITNALIGLLFIIFSVTLLQFIGVTIFNIPGFGTTTP